MTKPVVLFSHSKGLVGVGNVASRAIDLSDPLLPARVVVKRFGISDMTLWRWLQDSDLRFPKPTVIQKRRYFRASEIAAFEARQASE